MNFLEVANNRRQQRVIRRGSALILCVALLVLLALIGMALLSTTSIDRSAVVEHTRNTQVDLLIEGMTSIASACVTGDLFDPTTGEYRRALVPDATGFGNYFATGAGTLSNRYGHWDMPEPGAAVANRNPPQADFWLASRYPTCPDPFAPPSASNPIVWRCLTAPVIASSPTATTFEFDSPYVNTSAPIPVYAHCAERTLATPTSIAVRQRDGSITHFPALKFVTSGSAVPKLTLAADADGDGIADSGLCHIPGADANGISYYVGIRIIDNNSAINVNTAWSREFDYGPYGQTAYSTGDVPLMDGGNPTLAQSPGNVENAKGFYRSNVGLLGLLNSYVASAHISSEMDLLNQTRWGGMLAANLAAAGAIAFDYSDQSDAMENGFTRALDHPAFNATARYRAFSLADQASLASRFCVFNPHASESEIESVLTPSLVAGSNALVSPKRYSPNDPPTDTVVTKWYNDNFNWDLGRRPLRSMLVTRNATSNLVPVVNCFWSAGLIDPLVPSNSGAPGSLPGMANYEPATAAPNGVPMVVKTDINTAKFDELWRAFWCVMADDADPTHPPFPADPMDPMQDGLMFRSPIRNLYPSAGKLTPSMMLELRAALAAANAIDLRDSDDDITSHEIALYDIPFDPTSPSPRALPAPSRTARVFGTERQPFITEIYVNTFAGPYGSTATAIDKRRNPKGYVAVELFNPYGVPITLHNWSLGVVDRRYAGSDPKLRIISLTSGALPTGVAFPTSVVIPAGGYGANPRFLGGGEIRIPARGHIILENLPPVPSRAAGLNQTTDAQYRPASVPTIQQIEDITVYVPNLSDVINDAAIAGGELVLLRPRLSKIPAGQTTNLSASSAADNVYDEGTESSPRLADFVPIDSYDFTGLIATPPAAEGSESPGAVMHYVRENGDADSHAWKFVYPGLMLPNPVTPNVMTSRHSGVFVNRFTATTYTDSAAGSVEPTDCNFGDYDDHCTEYAANGRRVAPWPGVQLINDDMAGFNKGIARFPFGAFARNGDLLQVPFIGGYQIRDIGQAQTDPTFFELNAVTMDCSFVDDQKRDPATNRRAVDPIGSSDDSAEQLGRFCPIQQTATVGGQQIVDDYNVHGSYSTTPATDPSDTVLDPPAQRFWQYHFATRLFDYLTVQSPASDRSPNVDPDPAKFVALGITTQPPPVTNGTSRASDPYNSLNVNAEKTIGVDGLININTAPWWVIASLPLLPNDLAGPPGNQDLNSNGIPDYNEMLAKQIVAWRDGDGTSPPHGPFRSIFDLNRVVGTDPAGALTPPGFPSASLPAELQHKIPSFQDAIRFYATHLRVGYTDPDPIDGDVAPNSFATTDGVHEIGKPDFEERYLMLDRISNLVTTRSDSFTVYIIVQGWRNAGTATPELVVQRRAAMILDRNNVTGVSGAANPKATMIPSD
ncbi:hypothetical protein BH09PLA1_BH09PLA1_03500 [soil metagenome]